MWLQLITALIGVASAIISSLQQRQQLTEAQAALIAQQLQRTLDDLQKAQKARDDAAAAAAADPNWVRGADPDSRD